MLALRCLAFLCVASLSSSIVLAQQSQTAPATLDQLTLEAARKRADTIQEELRSTSDEVRRLGDRTNETEKRVYESESRMTLIQSRLEELEQQNRFLARSSRERLQVLATLLGEFDQGKAADADYMLEVVAKAEEKLIKEMNEFERVNPKAKRGDPIVEALMGKYEEIQYLGHNLKELKRIIAEIGSERSNVAREGSALLDVRTRLASLNENRRILVARQKASLASSRALTAEAEVRLLWEQASSAIPTEKLRLSDQAFLSAQRVLSSGAEFAVSQMSARLAAGSGELSQLVREVQDYASQLRRMEDALVETAGQTRDGQVATRTIAELMRVENLHAAVLERIGKEFPEYGQLANPQAVAIGDLQQFLRPEEALILFLDLQRSTSRDEIALAWIVTKTDVLSYRAGLTPSQIAEHVTALRCGLDEALWDEDASKRRCASLLNVGETLDGNTLPFDTGRANTLYDALLGQGKELIRDKHLLVVPSRSLTQLPFHVLVTGNSSAGSIPWLIRSNAITVLPSASSLKALRHTAKQSVAKKPIIAIGNPLLDGDPATRSWEAEWAGLARSKQACATNTPLQQVAANTRRRAVAPMPMRGGRADIEHLRSQSPLHETAEELCAVASSLKASRDDVLLGARGTESAIKSLSTSGRLADYRVVHFATHGALAGEIAGTNEPGLILTPPATASELDDGYLSSSEVAELKIDADWVILSACNTAGSESRGAEALSGLARAFIYAGARAMLVSHWAVNSVATVKLITGAVGIVGRSPNVGRAEALRRAMLAMIDQGGRDAHPTFWAPFIVVGEGSAK